MPYIGNQPAPQNVTSTEITDGTITNADINASAAIDITKLSTTVVPTSGATLTGALNFGDSVNANFGAGNDLQIYHDGSRSIIQDNGTGNLRIQANNLELNNADNSENYLFAANNGAVTLYYDNAEKLATTPTGVNITGTLVSDGLTVESGGNTLSSTGNNVQFNRASCSSCIDQIGASCSLLFRTTPSQTSRLKIDNNGDISFYEDTGTTAKFFWDASAESLGIGTSSPDSSYKLDVAGNVVFGDGGGFDMNVDGTRWQFSLGGSEKMRIDSSGNVGIGCSPAQTLHLKSADPVIRLEDSSPDGVYAQIDGAGGALILSADGGAGNASSFIGFRVDGTALGNEAMRIDSSGNVGIGTDNPIADLSIVDSSTGSGIEIQPELTTNTNRMTNYDRVESAYKKFRLDASEQQFYISGSQKMTLDTSGNLLVGKTSSSTSSVGAEFNSDGTIVGVRSGGHPLLLNRTTSDGAIAQFRKDGTTVGSISVNGGDNLQISASTADHAGLEFATHIVAPLEAGAASSGTIDLGASSARFKDLHLSGAVNAATGTYTGDVQVAGLYVGSTNTSYDFYNNGTTYLNGATTIDDSLLSGDIHIKSGTSGTYTQGLLFTLTDNADAQAYIKKTSYYMHYNAHQNEGHRFTVHGGDDLLRMHGANNGTRPDSIDILAANGLYMGNTQVMTLGRALTNITGATINGNLTLEDGQLYVGNVSSDNWTRVRHIGTDGYGFDWQHSNASVIVNEQGSTNQVLVLGDVDGNGDYTGLFGVAHSTDTGSNWTKKLDLRGNGELYIGSSGTSKVWHAGNDGSGSGLDADLLDGVHGSAFARKDSGVPDFQYGIQAGELYLGTDGDTDGDYNLTLKATGNNILYLNHGGTGHVDSLNAIYAPQFYDRDNSSYYVDPASTSNLNKWMSGSANGNSTAPRYDTSAYVLQSQHWYGHNSGQGMYVGESGNDVYVRGQMAIGGTAIESGYALTMTGDIDMNNSAINYLTQVHFQDNVRFVDEGNDQYLRYKAGDTGGFGMKFYNGSDQLHGYVYGDGAGSNFGLLANDGSWAIQCRTDKSSIYHRLDTPIMYDQDDTAYYVNPNSDSRMARLNIGDTSNYIIIGDESAGFNTSYAQIRTTNTGALRIDSKQGQDLYLQWYNNSSTHVISESPFRSPLYYDRNDTAYYLDPASTSDSALRVRGGALFGGNTTWGDFLMVGGNGRQNYINNTTTASVATTDGNLHLDAASGHDTYLNYYDGNNVFFGSGSNTQVGRVTNAGVAQFASFADNSNTAYYFDGSATGDSIRVAGNIVAYYSDERLKDIEGNIDSPLEKVSQLNGFYYTANKKAQTLGYK